jgi:hypothetical protein
MEPMPRPIAQEPVVAVARSNDASGLVLLFDYEVVTVQVIGAR